MSSHYRRSPGVAGRIIDGEAVLVKTLERDLYVLNPSGTRIWARADGRRTGDELVSGNGDAEGRDFLTRMVEEGLMEELDSPLPEAEPFPQESVPPSLAEPPAIVATEKVDVFAGSACDSVDIMTCSFPTT